MSTGSLNPEIFLKDLFQIAVNAADPIKLVPSFLPPKPDGRVLIIGAGKASARMAEAVENEWGACEGLVITRYGYARETQSIEIVEASHPIPDQNGVDATKRMLQLLENLKQIDHVIALISGGGSALLCAPADSLTLTHKQEVNKALLESGAPIKVINAIRKSLSKVKGGRLAAHAYPAKITTLMISDIPGDDPAFIASGPTVQSDENCEDIVDFRKKWLPDFPHLDNIIRANPSPRNIHAQNHIIAAPSQSLKAAAHYAQQHGTKVTILGDDIEGEAREIARHHAKIALESQSNHLILSGGELTVTKRGNGIGGPNAEYALALALELGGEKNIFALACDSDGVDGAAEVAGAYIYPEILNEQNRALAEKALGNNDAHSFFARAGTQIITGPTLTNVNDFRAILIL